MDMRRVLDFALTGYGWWIEALNKRDGNLVMVAIEWLERAAMEAGKVINSNYLIGLMEEALQCIRERGYDGCELEIESAERAIQDTIGRILGLW